MIRDGKNERILVVDDDESVLTLCANYLRRQGYDVLTTTDPTQVIPMALDADVDLVITDVRMPEISGLDLLRNLKKVSPEIAVIIMTGFASMQIAIDAVNEGAYSFIPKPFHLKELLITVNNALERKRLTHEIIRLKTLVSFFQVSEEIGNVREITRLFQIILEAVARETQSERAVVFYRDEESGEFYARFVLGISEFVDKHIPIPLSHEHILKLFQHRRPILFRNSEYLMDDNGLADFYRDTTMLAVPLQGQHKQFGVLSLFKKESNGVFSEADRDVAAILATQAAVALDNAELLLDYEILFLESMSSLVKTLDERDPYTHGHSVRVAKISTEIGRHLGLNEQELDDLHYAGLLHDIGKIGIRDEILLKPGPLSREEYDIIKTHPERGYNILKPIQRLKNVAEAVYTHHEWFDGRGYPRGLKGDDIPIWGSIIAVADAYDTITTDRIYRERKHHAEAVTILEQYGNTQFHPKVVKVLKNIDIFAMLHENA